MTATLHAAPVVLTMSGAPLLDGAVLVEGSQVTDVGLRDVLARRHPAARLRHWTGVMTPGLVNAHTHLEYGPPFADLAVGDLVNWSERVQSRILTDAEWQAAARGSAHLLLKSGTTAVADVVTHGPGLTVARSLGLQGSTGTGTLTPCRPTSTAVLMTRSDAFLGVEQAPVADLLSRGVVALGTDSLASCPDLDLLAEARSTRDVARRQGLEHPEEALVRALTLGGARAVGQDLGTLEVGRRADLAVFDVPTDAPYRGLVEHGAGRCVATVLGGRLVHRR